MAKKVENIEENQLENENVEEQKVEQLQKELEAMKQKVEKAEEEQAPKKRFRIFNLILFLILIGVVIVFILFMKTSITNFNAVKDGKEPTGYKEVVEYEKDFKEIKYYKYNLFKIQVIKSKENTSYTLVPSFVKDY